MADVKKGGIVAAKQNAANGNNGGAVVAQAKNKSVAYVMKCKFINIQQSTKT